MSVIKPVNDYAVHGRPVACARVRDVDDEQGIVICDLLDAENRVLAENRYFHLDQAPFEISGSDRAALGTPAAPTPGLPPSLDQEGPDDSWNKSDIQAWLESQEIPYKKGDTKPVLLEIIKNRLQDG